MRLAFSLGLWLAGTTAVVMGTHGWLQLRSVKSELVGSAQRDLTLITTAVRTAAEAALRDRQQPDIAILLDELELKDPGLHVFVFDAGGKLLSSSPGSEEALGAARALAGTGGRPKLTVRELDSPAGIATRAPMRVDRANRGHVVVVRPTDALRAHLADERHAAILSIVGLIVALALVIAAVLHLRLHLPLRQVIAGIRRVAGGDLTARMDLRGHDEIAELATEFDAMTQSLASARERLARELTHRQQLESEMQRANRLMVVGELAAALAHEIGSPLQVLNGRARTLARHPELPADAQRNADILVEQTDRVATIVERLLHVARRKAPKLEPLDLRESITLVTELLAHQATRAEVRIACRLEEVPPVRADAGQVQQILLNLLQNAIRASAPGGNVTVTLSPSRDEYCAVADEPPWVILRVEDTGPGVPDTLRQRVFEPFVSEWTTGAEPPGTGLGLSVVKSIAIEHGGSVQVDTPNHGSGARFTVRFPVTLEPAKRAEVQHT